MNNNDIKNMLKNININLNNISDENIKNTILVLFNIIEYQSAELKKSKDIIQKLRDEINELKGEQSKPDIKPKNKDKNKDISSESDRKNNDKPKRGKRGTKKDKIKITRSEICKVDPDILPADAEFKGYEPKIVQGLIIKLDNIEFLKEKYYSRSLNKTFIAKLPPGYEGEFNPTVKSTILILKHAINTSKPKILEFLKCNGIKISETTISRILIKNKDEFHKEKDLIYISGLESTIFQHIDDTGARVNGENFHTHILCNDLYTAYFTLKHKDRLTIIDILRNFRDRRYCFNEEAFVLLEQMRVSKGKIKVLKKIEQNRYFSQDDIENQLTKLLPKLGKIHKARILEATAIAAYHKETEYPVIKVIVSDNAPQFKHITEEQALCWIHEGRHYKKLIPVIPYNKEQVEIFLDKFWQYYKKLLKFKKNPCDELAQILSDEFDRIFSIKTGYEELDDRIGKTKNNKKELLKVLKYSQIPLHNNSAELGARQQVRKRDVSLQTKTVEGTKAIDTFLTIVETAKKLGINVYEYFYDRITKINNILLLSEIIYEKMIDRGVKFCDSS